MDGNRSNNGDNGGRLGGSPREVLQVVLPTLMARRGGSVDGLDATSSEGVVLILDDGRTVSLEIDTSADLDVAHFTAFLDVMLEDLQYLAAIRLSRIVVARDACGVKSPDVMRVDDNDYVLFLADGLFSRPGNAVFDSTVNRASKLGIVLQNPRDAITWLVVDETSISLARSQLGAVGGAHSLAMYENTVLSKFAARTSGVPQIELLSEKARKLHELKLSVLRKLAPVDDDQKLTLLSKEFWTLVYAAGRSSRIHDEEAFRYASYVRSNRVLRVRDLSDR